MHVPRAIARSAPPKRIVLEARHVIVLACFLATLSAYVERVGFSIAYTAMAKAEQVDEATKGTVLSAFYWGYGVAQVGFPAYYSILDKVSAKSHLVMHLPLQQPFDCDIKQMNFVWG